MTFRNLMAGTAFVLTSPVSLAAWSSGGGELIQDAHNPWFLENTREVTYCLVVDEPTFGVSAERAASAIEWSLAWWRREFARAPLDPHDARIATQTFVSRPCPNAEGDVDLVFRFGALTAEQREYLREPQRYVGIAVRTDYDEVQLKGRGFIYVAPERGPDRPRGDRVLDKPWQDGEGARLERVLVHELGHVFGLQHLTQPEPSGRGSPWVPQLMAADYPEAVVSAADPDLGRREGFPAFFTFSPLAGTPTINGTCSLPDLGVLGQVLQLPAGYQCARLSYRVDARGVDVTVDVSREQNGPTEPAGVISFSGPGNQPRVEAHQVITVRLNPRQRVFPDATLSVSGPKVKTTQYLGVFYNRLRGISVPMLGKFGPRSYQIGGAGEGGALVPDALRPWPFKK